MVIPTVIEDSGRGERAFDIFSRLLRDRVILLNDGVDDHSASLIIAQLLFLDSEDSRKPIQFYINSPGGAVTAGLAIHDTMLAISAPVHTTCVGMCASMGAFLLASGEPGERRALPNSRVMIHQPSAGTSGKVTDMDIAMKLYSQTKETLTRYLSEYTGQTYEKVLADCERDYWLTAKEAQAYGLVDTVTEVTRRKKGV